MADLRALTLHVIRHGECEHNIAGRIAGQNDTPLTQRGREQARANGRLLRDLCVDLDAADFFASPLHRASATMELLREAAGLAPSGYRADRRLMEIDFGDQTGLPIRQAGPYGAAHWDHVRPNGESLAMVHARIGAFLSGLARDAVIVTHAGPLRMIRAHLLGLSREATLDYHPPNAGIMRLSGGSEAWFGD